jgi:large subunit ribosomal protein L24
MKIKVGDNVKVIAGNDKGKTGKVIKTLRKENRVIVEGVRMVTKHIKPNRMNQNGGRIQMEAPIDASNVKLIEAAESKKTVKKAKTAEKKTTKKKEGNK